VTSTDVRTTNISQSLPHKMAEYRWYEEIASLSPYVYYLTFKRDKMLSRRSAERDEILNKKSSIKGKGNCDHALLSTTVSFSNRCVADHMMTSGKVGFKYYGTNGILE